MRPERIGLSLVHLGLFEWVLILKPGVQSIQRTYAFPTFGTATDFVAAVGEAAEEEQIFPHVEACTHVAEAVPTLVQVTFLEPDLKLEHLNLAKAIEVAYAAEMETAGAVAAPAVDV